MQLQSYGTVVAKAVLITDTSITMRLLWIPAGQEKEYRCTVEMPQPPPRDWASRVH